MKNKEKNALEFLIRTLEEEKERLYRQFTSEFYRPDLLMKVSQAKIASLIVRLLTPQFKNNLLFWKTSYQKYKVSLHEKLCAFDHLFYIIKKAPQIPYALFDKKDHLLLEKFLRNVVLLSFFDLVEQEKLFSKKDKKRQRVYQQFKKKRHLVGFKSVVAHFDEAVFVEYYGIPYLKNKKRFKGSTIIDGGAFIGDTSFIFNEKLKPGKVVALEPDPVNFDKLLKNISLNRLDNFVPLQKGLAGFDGDLYLGLDGGPAAHLSTNTSFCVKTKVCTIDTLVQELGLGRVGLIKLDIEGYELSALKSAEKTIKKFRPALIVSLYHKGEDFFQIPLLLKKFVPSYQFRFVILRADSPIFERMLIAQDSSFR